MPDTSHALSLPLIQPSQAQKHVTHNEALRILDAVVQLVVIAADQSGPPTAPQSGDRYIVAPSGVGAWLGHDGDIAVYADAAWSFITPLQTPKQSLGRRSDTVDQVAVLEQRPSADSPYTHHNCQIRTPKFIIRCS